MKNNTKGMTLVEVLIAIAIFTVVIGITYGMYIANTKAISKTDIKAMMQTEAQYIQETISNIGMQSSGIVAIDATPIKDSSEFDGFYEVKYLDMKFLDKENKEYIYRIVVDDSKSEKSKALKLQKLDKDAQSILTDSTLSENVYSFKIKPIVKVGSNESLINSKSVEICIDLGKKKGFSDVNYNMSTLITFRNK